MSKIEIKSMWKSPFDGKLYNLTTHPSVDENGRATDNIYSAIRGLRKKDKPYSNDEVAWIEESEKPATKPIEHRAESHSNKSPLNAITEGTPLLERKAKTQLELGDKEAANFEELIR